VPEESKGRVLVVSDSRTTIADLLVVKGFEAHEILLTRGDCLVLIETFSPAHLIFRSAWDDLYHSICQISGVLSYRVLAENQDRRNLHSEFPSDGKVVEEFLRQIKLLEPPCPYDTSD